MKRFSAVKHYSIMSLVCREEAQRQLRMHRFAVRLYETLVERYGINHEQAQLALRLVEVTKPDGSDVIVSVPNGRLAQK
jgi:hypothetical protein